MESTLLAMDDMFLLGVTVDGWTATGETDRQRSGEDTEVVPLGFLSDGYNKAATSRTEK